MNRELRRTEGFLTERILLDRATVFLQNLLLLPRSESELLAGPREVFDRFEDFVATGWLVD